MPLLIIVSFILSNNLHRLDFFYLPNFEMVATIYALSNTKFVGIFLFGFISDILYDVPFGMHGVAYTFITICQNKKDKLRLLYFLFSIIFLYLYKYVIEILANKNFPEFEWRAMLSTVLLSHLIIVIQNKYFSEKIVT